MPIELRRHEDESALERWGLAAPGVGIYEEEEEDFDFFDDEEDDEEDDDFFDDDEDELESDEEYDDEDEEL